MDYKELIHRLVNELSFRVGIPDLESKEQQTIVSEILSEWGNLDEKKIIMEFLTEAEPEKTAEDEKYKNTGGSGYVKAVDYDKWKSNPKGDFEKFTKEGPGVYKAMETNDTTDDTKTTKATAVEPGSEYAKNAAELLTRVQAKEAGVKGKEAGSKSDLKTSPVSRLQTIDRGGDSKVKNQAFKYGFKEIVDKKGNVIFKPAPGNAGSLLNEVVSGEVAQMLEEDPNLSDEQVIKVLKERFGNTPLFNSKGKNGNTGNGLATGVKTSEIPKGENKGLYSKLLLASRSGRRKHTKCVASVQK